MVDEKTYKVGYKRPPENTRFKQGQSGNPKGRAVGTLNLKTDLEQELSERIPIREGERHIKVSKQRAMLKALVAMALKGNTKAAAIVLQLVAKTTLPEDNRAETNGTVPTDELAIFEEYIARRLNDRALSGSTDKAEGQI